MTSSVFCVQAPNVVGFPHELQILPFKTFAFAVPIPYIHLFSRVVVHFEQDWKLAATARV